MNRQAVMESAGSVLGSMFLCATKAVVRGYTAQSVFYGEVVQGDTTWLSTDTRGY